MKRNLFIFFLFLLSTFSQAQFSGEYAFSKQQAIQHNSNSSSNTNSAANNAINTEAILNTSTSVNSNRTKVNEVVGKKVLSELSTSNTEVVSLSNTVIEGSNNEGKSLLKWEALLKQDVSNYEIQYSLDGSSFVTLETVKAITDNNTLKSYSYLHTYPVPGDNYYRLKQTDLNGSSVYSKAVVINHSTSNKTINFIYNPFSKVAIIVNKDEAPMSISILSKEGMIVKEQRAFSKVEILDLSKFSSGTYVFNVITDKNNLTQEIVQ